MCAGTQTAAIAAGGYQAEATVETYNGTSWSEENNMLVGRDYGGNNFGTTTAALFVSGANASPWPNTMTNVETWNGTSWTEGTNVLTARRNAMGAGTTTAAVTAGGYAGPPGVKALTEIYNGTSWTETADLNTAKTYVGSAGATSTAALCVAGEDPSPGVSNELEEWNGTSWSGKANLNTARSSAASAGTITAALAFGGAQPAYSALTEYYDGTTWTEVADLATGVQGAYGCGTSTSALNAGGQTPSVVATTEEFTAATTANILQEGQVWYNSTGKVLKGFGKQGTGAWASGGTMTNARYSFAGFGTQTAAVSATGTGAPGVITKTEEYNGTAWTEVNDNLSGGDSISGCGTLTAGIINARSPSSLLTESYDGTCWTEVNDMNTPSRGKRTDAGTQAAGLCVGGENHPAVMVNTELWDGTSWTEVAGDLNNGRSTQDGGTGTQTAALVAGGTPPADSPVYDYAETWDGTSWTEVNDLNTARSYGVAFGEQTDCYYAGGVATTLRALVESYNGTSWTEVADLGTAAKKAAGGGDQTAGIVMGGATAGDPTGLAQEWSIPDAVKTFTAS